MALVHQHGLRPESIESVYVGMPSNTMKIVDNRDMHNICLQDMLSAAIVRGGMTLRESHFPAVLSEPAYLRLRPRIALHGDPDLDRDQPSGRGAVLRITDVQGRTVSTRVDHPRGHSQRGGVTWTELAAKWHEGLPESDIDRMLSIAQRLEDLEDVNELVTAVRAVR